MSESAPRLLTYDATRLPTPSWKPTDRALWGARGFLAAVALAGFAALGVDRGDRREPHAAASVAAGHITPVLTTNTEAAPARAQLAHAHANATAYAMSHVADKPAVALGSSLHASAAVEPASAAPTALPTRPAWRHYNRAERGRTWKSRRISRRNRIARQPLAGIARGARRSVRVVRSFVRRIF